MTKTSWKNLSFKEVDANIEQYYNDVDPYTRLALIINNCSSYPLKYKNFNYTTGWPMEPVLNMFDKDEVIAPGKASGMLWCRHRGNHFGNAYILACVLNIVKSLLLT